MPETQPKTAPRSYSSPSIFELSPSDWWRILVSSVKAASRDRLGLAAAGVAFYVFVALVPLLLAAVLVYGLVADRASVADQLVSLATVLPGTALQLIREQLDSIISGPADAKGWGLVFALGVALYYASNGAAAVIGALGVAYDQEDRRSFLKLTIISLLLTLGGLAAGAVVAGAIVALTALSSLIPVVGGTAVLAKIIVYLVLLLAGMAAAGVLYRFGPHEAEPCWRWVSAGAVLASVGWLLLTLAFGLYVRTIGDYSATYGSLSAVIVLLTWLYLSAYVLLFGAEFNAMGREHKHGTAPHNLRGEHPKGG